MGGQGEMLSAALLREVALAAPYRSAMLNAGGAGVERAIMTPAFTVIVSSVFAHHLISPVLIFGGGPICDSARRRRWGLTLSFGVGSLVLIADSAPPIPHPLWPSAAYRWSGSRSPKSSRWAWPGLIMSPITKHVRGGVDRT